MESNLTYEQNSRVLIKQSKNTNFFLKRIKESREGREIGVRLQNNNCRQILNVNTS